MLIQSHKWRCFFYVSLVAIFSAVSCNNSQEQQFSIQTPTPVIFSDNETLNEPTAPKSTEPPTQPHMEVSKPILPTNVPTEIAAVNTNIPTPHITSIGNYGGTLTIPTEAWFESLNPHMEGSDAFAAWGPGIAYSRLMKFKTNESISLPSLSTECDLCSNWIMVSPKEFLFEIRKDINWHYDNVQKSERVTAKDIAYSLQLQGHDSSPNSHIIHMIENVEAMSDDELRINLVWPDADFFAALANGRTKIVSPHRTDSYQADHSYFKSATSGPWTLDKYDENGIAKMISRMGITDPPRLDAIQFNFVPDSTARVAGYRVGLLDLINLHTTNTDSKHIQARFQNPVPGSGFELAFNTNHKPLDSKVVRQTIMASTNPTLVIDNAWEGQGFFSFGFPWSNSKWAPNPNLLQTFFSNTNPKIATNENQILRIDITVGNFNKNHNDSVELLSKQLTESGFNPVINYVDRRTYANHWQTGDFQILAGPTFPQSTPNGYLLPVLHSDGKWNTTKHKDNTLDSLLEKQAIEYDSDARTTIIQMINVHLLENAYRFMPITNMEAWAWPDKMINFHPNFSSGEYSHWQHVWIEP